MDEGEGTDEGAQGVQQSREKVYRRERGEQAGE
jgi:hypothetical protein